MTRGIRLVESVRKGLVLGLLLATSAVAAPRIAALDFTVIGIDKSMGSFYAEHVSARLEGKGVHVTTQRDIAAVLSVERRKQLCWAARMTRRRASRSSPARWGSRRW